MKLFFSAILGVTAAMTLTMPTTAAALQLGAPFCDNMILQREMDVPVWGWSQPGAEVTVEFAGQKKTATARANGKFMVSLDPLKASFEPAKMTVSSPITPEPLTITNVLVGEVWMASGQSNMQWPAKDCDVGKALIPQIKARVEAGEEKMPVIREARVTGRFSSLYPTQRAQGKWAQGNSSDEWNEFSAIAFAFAYDLASELKVPVGILNCSFSATRIEAWIPREGFAGGTDEFTRAIYQKILDGDVHSPGHEAVWNAYYETLRAWGEECAERMQKGIPVNPRPPAPGNLDNNRDATWMCNGMLIPMAPYAIRGAIWNQGYANGHDGITYRNNLHSLIRGWRAVWGRPDLPVYFHQFYSGGASDTGISLYSFGEMRLGTWLAHRDIPNAAMASQIDITGTVHYRDKTVPGQRLARHALKNQYPTTKLSSARLKAVSASGMAKDIVANGPMFRGYTVQDGKLILELDHAQGLTVGQFMTVPVDEKTQLFYLADGDLTWHRAEATIKGETIVLSAAGLKEPRGVAYGCNGVGNNPGIYNEAKLPLTPFVVYDHKLVVSAQWDLEHVQIPGFETSPEMFVWPMEYFAVAGKVIDPMTYGLQLEHSKLPLLAPQFRDGGVIQADVPTRIYGMALPKSEVTVTFAGIEKTVKMGEYQTHWEATYPAMPATDEPKTLHAVCKLNGKVAHERTIRHLLVGDVWYLASQGSVGVSVTHWRDWEPPKTVVRSIAPRANRRTAEMPDRYKLTTSGWQQSRFYSNWDDATGLARVLGDRIHAKTGKPVGIVCMDASGKVPIKRWVGYKWLGGVPAWKADVDELHSRYVLEPRGYAVNAEAYINNWQAYWKKIADDPVFAASNESSGVPRFPGMQKVTTPATMTYNMLVASFGPANFKGVVFLTYKDLFAGDEGAAFGEELAVMANCWKETFADGTPVMDPHFIYAMPDKALAPKISEPAGIKGASTAIPMKDWLAIGDYRKTSQIVTGKEFAAWADAAVDAVYE